MILSGKKTNKNLQFEKVPRDASLTIVHDKVSGNPLPCNYHYHPELELTFINSGSGKVLLGDEWHNFQDGSLFLIGKNVPHYFVSLLLGDQIAVSENIKLRSDFSEIGLLSLPEFKKLKQFFESANPAIIFNPDMKFAEDMKKITQLDAEEKIMALYNFLIKLNKKEYKTLNINKNFYNINEQQQKIMEKTISFLQKNFTRTITLAETAKNVRMESESFRRFFKKSIRVNFSDYVLDLRLACARRLLIETNLSISEIAIRSGFNNLSNFNRHFLARIKMTPRQYRLNFSS